MRRVKAVAWAVLLCAVLMAGCDTFPAPTPTPTRGPREEITLYSGQLTGIRAQVAVLVGSTRARVFVCSADPALWRGLSAWLTQGAVRGRNITVTTAASAARLEAEVVSDTVQGTYTASDGTAYLFTATRLVDTRMIASGVGEGLFRLDDARFPGQGEPALVLALVETASDPTGRGTCALAFRGGLPLTRMPVSGVWQGGMTVFTLPDLPLMDGQPPLWQLPGRIGQIDSIALPPPAP